MGKNATTTGWINQFALFVLKHAQIFAIAFSLSIADGQLPTVNRAEMRTTATKSAKNCFCKRQWRTLSTSFVFRVNYDFKCSGMVQSSNENGIKETSCFIENLFGGSNQIPTKIRFLQFLELDRDELSNNLVVVSQTTYDDSRVEIEESEYVDNVLSSSLHLENGSVFSYPKPFEEMELEEQQNLKTANQTTIIGMAGIQVNIVGVNYEDETLILSSAVLFENHEDVDCHRNATKYSPILRVGDQIGLIEVAQVITENDHDGDDFNCWKGTAENDTSQAPSLSPTVFAMTQTPSVPSMSWTTLPTTVRTTSPSYTNRKPTTKLPKAKKAVPACKHGKHPNGGGKKAIGQVDNLTKRSKWKSINYGKKLNKETSKTGDLKVKTASKKSNKKTDKNGYAKSSTANGEDYSEEISNEMASKPGKLRKLGLQLSIAWTATAETEEVIQIKDSGVLETSMTNRNTGGRKLRKREKISFYANTIHLEKPTGAQAKSSSKKFGRSEDAKASTLLCDGDTN